jgi:hypothetical protein
MSPERSTEGDVFRNKEKYTEKYTLGDKTEHVKLALQKKIAAIEQSKKLTDAEKKSISLTKEEYDLYRNQSESLSGSALERKHTWNFIIEKSGIPVALRSAEYSIVEIRQIIINFYNNFKQENGRFPTTEEYHQIQWKQKQFKLPSPSTIKRVTGQTLGDYLVGLGIYPVRRKHAR